MSDSDEASDPWDEDSHFGIDNLPFGIGSSASHAHPQGVCRYQGTVIFLDELQNMLSDLGLPDDTFLESSLNDFAQMGIHTHRAVRAFLKMMIQARGLPQRAQEPISQVQMHLPISVTDFTIFSSGYEVPLSTQQQSPGPQIVQPETQWPSSHSLRPSAIRISGQSVIRPRGYKLEQQQSEEPGDDKIVYGPSNDFVAETLLGVVTGRNTPEGQTSNFDSISNNVFGYVLMIKWVARDFKRFDATMRSASNISDTTVTMSPWIVPRKSIYATSIPLPDHGGSIAPHLRSPRALKIPNCDVFMRVVGGHAQTADLSMNTSSMPWAFEQLMAHQIGTGLGIRTTAVLAWTIHAPESEAGSSQPGDTPSRNAGALKNGDTVNVVGWSEVDGGFGSCFARLVAPSNEGEWTPETISYLSLLEANQREA